MDPGPRTWWRTGYRHRYHWLLRSGAWVYSLVCSLYLYFPRQSHWSNWSLTRSALAEHFAFATLDQTTPKHGVDEKANSAPSHYFQLFSQNPMEHHQQSKSRYNQNHCVERKHAKSHPGIPLLQTKEHVWLLATA